MSILLVQPSRHFVPVRSLSLWRGELPPHTSQHFARQVIRSAAPVTQNRLSKPEGLSSLAGKQRPDLLTALMNMSLVHCLPRKMRLCRSSSNVPRLPAFLDMPQNPHVLLTLDKVHNPLRLPRAFSTAQLPKVHRTRCVFTIFTSTCDLVYCQHCKNGHFFLHLEASGECTRI